MTTEENNELKTQLAVLTEKVTGWMETTTEYRKNLCNKVDIITKNFSTLPCSERKGWYTGMNKQIAFMWVILSGVVIALLKEFFAK
jgi:hypothetical protein